MISEEDNQGNSQAPKDNLYHLDVISEKYYTEPQSHASKEMIQLEPQLYTKDQTEVRQSQPQSSAFPIHNMSTDQVISEFESLPKPQVSSETQLKILPHITTRGKPKIDYEPLFTSKPHYPMNNFVSYHKLSKKNKTFMKKLSAISIPNSVQEALKDPKWKEDMNEEIRSLQKNSTWEVVDLPIGKKSVECRWVFTIKHKMDGTIERFKARLVAKGYTQTYGIDY